jgi:hypothetical protein
MPHSGQNRLRFGRRAPQLAQLVLAASTKAFLPPLGLEGAERLGRPAAQRPDLRPVVLVGDLAGAVVELELLQRREGPVTLLG